MKGTISMDKFVKIIFSIFIIIFIMNPIKTSAADLKFEYENFYFETEISEQSSSACQPFAVTKTKTGSKTTYCKDPTGKVLWYVKVTGTFSYNGSSATCTSVSVTAASNNNDWKISNRSCTKKANQATASATGKRYSNGTVTNSITKSVTLSCSKTGTLS